MKRKDTARLIITEECNRDCSYCCNKFKWVQEQAQTIYTLKPLKSYSTICITGGEPMLKAMRTLGIMKKLKFQNPNVQLFLYTAFYKDVEHFFSMSQILKEVSGVHYTLHHPSTKIDRLNFQIFQDIIKIYKEVSFRLYILPQIKFPVLIHPNRWTRIESKPYIPEKECCLPPHEDLFILK